MVIWPVIFVFGAVALVVAIFMPEVRAAIAWAAAAFVVFIILYVVSDVMRSFAQIRRDQQATKLIAVNEVQVDGLLLTGTSARDYHMVGLVRNLSPSHTLTDTRFAVIVMDCVKNDCYEQGRGHVEIVRHVPPNQSAMFDTTIVTLPAMLAPRGERRFNTQIYLTVAQP